MITSLSGKRIAVPESRQLDILEGLLSRRGAQVIRCPMVSIIDAPESGPVTDWIRGFIAQPPSYFIVLTGEGIARLHGFAESGGINMANYQSALGQTTLISRGPKPARELRRYRLTPEYFAPVATTEGVIQLLDDLDIEGCSVAIQLYGDNPNTVLIDYLQKRSCSISVVAPYRYAAEFSRDRIKMLVSSLADKQVDAVVFTSKLQVERLFDVATELQMLDKLKTGLLHTCVAAIGPVVVAALAEQDCAVDIVPEEKFFMKPLVQLLAETLA